MSTISTSGEDDTTGLTGTHSVSDSTRQLPAPRAVGSYINGRYEVEWLIGTGGMGRVYLVTDRLYPDRPTALKTTLSHANEAALTLFRAEFGTMAALDHPNLAKVYDFERIVGSDEFLFTLEYLDGVNLRTHVQGGGWQPVAQAILLIGQVLSYIHNQGLVHLDLKPSNVMVVTSTKTVKVLDFGLSGMRTLSNLVLGTIPYMAPEVMQGLKPDGRADLYSLGVMAFELLCGRFPYPFGLGIEETLDCKLQRPVRFSTEERSRLPSWLCDLVEWLAATDPDARPASARVWVDALTEGLTTIPGLAPLADCPSRGVYGSAFAGRRSEQAELLAYVRGRVQRTAPDKPSVLMLWVCGPSGMGKSRLVQEVRHQLQLEDIPFIQGDCYDRDMGEYTSLGPVLLSAATLAVAAGKPELVTLHGPEIVKLVPGFGRDQGLVASLPFSNAKAERQRIHNAAIDFLLQTAAHIPFALYINDLQWAAQGTIDLLGSLIERLGTAADSRLALLASYRSNEVQGRPLDALVENNPDAAHYTRLLLAPLALEEVRTIASSMLAAPVAWSLAAKLSEGSQGQPLRIEEATRELLETGQLVVRDGIVELTADARELDLQLDIGAAILRRAGRLGNELRRIIDLLAVCARPVENSILAAVLELDLEEIHRAITDLVGRHLVVAVAGEVSRYNLFHDRIREALHAALSQETRERLHEKAGRAYFSILPAMDMGEQLFVTVAHLNLAKAPCDRKQREELIALNLRAAQASRSAAAFAPALHYVQKADLLLSPERWTEQREQALALALLRAELAYSLGDFDVSQKAAKEVIDHAKDLLQESRGWESWTLSAVGKLEHAQALDVGVDIANRLGTRIPKKPTKLHVLLDVLRFRSFLRGYDLDAFVHAKDMNNPAALQITRLMTAIGSSAYISRPNLIPFLMFEMTRQSLRHGHGPLGALAPTGSAIPFIILGDFAIAQRLTDIAEKLLPRTHKDFYGRSLYLIHAFLRHRTQSGQSTRAGFQAAGQAALESGDIEYVGYALSSKYLLDLLVGRSLNDTRNGLLKDLETVEQAGEHFRCWMAMLLQTIQGFQQQVSTPVAFRGPYHVTTENLNPMLKALQLGLQYYLAALFRIEVSESALHANFLAFLQEGIAGTFFSAHCHFYACLVWLRACREPRPFWHKQKFWWAAQRALRKLRYDAELSPHNHGHRPTLIAAELLRTRGKLKAAVLIYEKALVQTEQNGFSQESALMRELLAEVCLELGDRDRARTMLREARKGYAAWEASGKVQDLDKRYAHCLL